MDLILGGLLAYGFIKGIWKGLFTELASLLSLLLGLFIAVKFSGFTAGLLQGTYTGNPKYIAIIAFGITFIAVVAAIIVLGKVFTSLASLASLGIVNRILGGIFGLVKTALILSVSLNFFLKINSGELFAKKETLENSVFFYPVLQISETVFPVLQEWFATAKQDSDNSNTLKEF